MSSPDPAASPDSQREAALFQAAVQLTASARVTFLDAACHSDADLRRRLESSLAAHDAKQSQPPPKDSPPAAEPVKTVKLDLAGDSADQAVGQTIGRYRLLERIGEGGCGVVYVAEQTEPVRRRVALKVIKLGMDTRAVVARFEAERQALAMMDHPNIARVLDAGSVESQISSPQSQIYGGRPYFVMELVRGIRITDYCDQNQLSTADRLNLFIQVCHAIQHAHQKGIIHRDIKPSNILVTLHDGVPVPKVIDFGIAKATEGRLTDATVYTQLNQFIGTPAYMSPEQAEMSGLDIDTRSDIYSLGVLLYELLVGSTPFDPQELMASGIDGMRRTIREKEPLRPSTRLATVPGEELTLAAKRRSVEPARLAHLLRGDLDWVVMKCLEKDRTRRYETANGLALDIQRHLNNEPVVARPPSSAYRFQKLVRRNKLAFTAAAAIVVALLAGLGIATWAFVLKNRAYQRTLAAEREQFRLRGEAETARAAAAQQRDLAQARLYESLVREAHSIRKARQVGYRREVFDRLKQAVALGTSNFDADTVRREAAACLGDWVGLDPVDITNLANPPSAQALVDDGSLAAFGTAEGVVTLRETRTGKEVAELALGGYPYSLAFDQPGVALFAAIVDEPVNSGERPKSVRLEKWSLRGDRTWKRDWSRMTHDFQGLLSTAEGAVALSIDPANTSIAVRDLARDADIARIPIDARMPTIPIAAVSTDGRRLSFFSLEDRSKFDVQVEIWDLAATQRVECLKPRLGPGYGLSFGPDGKSLACTFENTLLVYDTTHFASTINVGGSFEGTSGGAIGGTPRLLAVPDGQEQAAHLINLRSGGEMADLRLPTSPTGAQFSLDGTVLLLSHQLGWRIIHLNVDREKIRLAEHLGGVPAVEFSPDGSHLASAGKDRSLRLWDLSPPYESRVLGQLPAPGQTLAYTPDGDFLICGYYNSGELSVWSPATGRRICTLPETAEFPGTTWSCAVSPDGKYLAAIGNGLRVWDLHRLTQPASSPGWTDSPLFTEPDGRADVVFDAASTRLAYTGAMDLARGYGTGLFVRDLAPGSRPMLIASNALNNFIQIQCFLPKSGVLAYVTDTRDIAFTDPATGRLLKTFPTIAPGDVSSLYIANIKPSPDGSKLAMLSAPGLGVDLWNPASGRRLYSLPEEPASIWWLAWSRDSQRLAISRANGEIAVWNLSEVESQLSQFGVNR